MDEGRQAMETRRAVIILMFVSGALASCTSDRRGDEPDPATFHWPMGIVADPSGEYVYVVSTNFDTGETGSTVVPVSVETHEILAGSAIEIGSFAGEIVIAGSDGIGEAGFVAVREDELIEYFLIDWQAALEGGAEVPVLDCGTVPDEEGGLARCEDGHGVQGIGEPEELLGSHRDPYALALGSDPVGGGVWLYSGSIVDGTFSVMEVDEDMTPNPGVAVELESGLHSIIEGPVVDGRRRVYVTNRMVNALHVLEVWKEGGSPRINVLDALQVAQVSSTGDFFRGIAMSNGGQALYIAFRSPPGLVVIDLDEDGNAGLRGIVPLGEFPAGVAVSVTDHPGRELVYVTDYLGDAVFCVDPVSLDVVDRILVDEGPYGIEVVRNDGLGVHRAYITAFEDDTVNVIDLDEESDTWHEIVAVIPQPEE